MSSKKIEEKGKKEAPTREKSEKSIKVDKDAKNEKVDTKAGNKDDPKKKAASKGKDDDSDDDRAARGKGGKGSVDSKKPGQRKDSDNDDDDDKKKKGGKSSSNAKDEVKKKPGKDLRGSDDDDEDNRKGKGNADTGKRDNNKKKTVVDDDSDDDKNRGAGNKKGDPKKKSVAGGKGRKDSDNDNDDDDDIDALRKGLKKKTSEVGKKKTNNKNDDDDDDDIEALRKGMKKKTTEVGKKKKNNNDDDDDDDDDDNKRKGKKGGGEERRKTKTGTRKSRDYDDDEEQDDEDDEFKLKKYRQEGDDDEMYIKVVYHAHRLRNSGMERVKWMCEGVRLNPDKKCYRSHKEEPTFHDHERYQCANGCKVNICDECAIYFKEYPEKPAAKIPEHPHPLYYRPADNGKWSCDIIDIKGAVCEHKHKKEEVERDHAYYKCLSGCNFRVCDLCAEKGRSLANPTTGKEEELAKVVFHPHKFKNTGLDRQNKWFCEGIYLTPNKNCLRFHKKDPMLRDHSRWQCTSDCNISLCDLCVEKFTDYEMPPIKADHRHPLYYRPADMTKWYCDTLASEKGICERKHKRELIAHAHPYYRCLEGCEFLLCDLCVKKFDKGNDKNEFLSPKTTKLDEKTMKHLQQSEEFEIYLEKTGISSAFTIIFGEILTKKIKADSVYGYAAMRLRQMGTDIAVAYSQYQREMALKEKEKLKGRKSTARESSKDQGDRKGKGKSDSKGSAGKKGKPVDDISDDDDDEDEPKSGRKKGGKAARDDSKDHKKIEKDEKTSKSDKIQAKDERKSAEPRGKADAKGDAAKEKSVKIDPKAKK